MPSLVTHSQADLLHLYPQVVICEATYEVRFVQMSHQCPTNCGSRNMPVNVPAYKYTVFPWPASPEGTADKHKEISFKLGTNNHRDN